MCLFALVIVSKRTLCLCSCCQGIKERNIRFCSGLEKKWCILILQWVGVAFGSGKEEKKGKTKGESRMKGDIPEMKEVWYFERVFWVGERFVDIVIYLGLKYVFLNISNTHIK